MRVNEPETKRIIAELSAIPEHQGWRFSYEYPGFYCYSRPGGRSTVFFTTEWGHEGMAIEVQASDGHHVEYGNRDCTQRWVQLHLPREGRTGPQIFEMVRPILDQLTSEAAQ